MKRLGLAQRRPEINLVQPQKHVNRDHCFTCNSNATVEQEWAAQTQGVPSSLQLEFHRLRVEFSFSEKFYLPFVSVVTARQGDGGWNVPPQLLHLA
jgi:hypothetical protein